MECNFLEFGLHIDSSYMVLLQQDRFDDLASRAEYRDIIPHLNYYFICRRPKITIDPKSFIFNKDHFTLDFLYQKEDKQHRIKITEKNYSGTTDLQISSKYPYDSFSISSKGEILHDGNASLSLSLFLGNFTREILDLEVIYIGQSYAKGKRIAIDRLTNHSTLQKIYFDAISKTPDKDIFIILASFNDIQKIVKIDGRASTIIHNETEDIDKLKNMMFRKGIENELKESHIINFVEASLINYFKPEYNIKLKDQFPNPNHQSYSDCYDLDLNSILVSFDTSLVKIRLYSDSVERKWQHIINYTLVNSDERKAMFDFYN